MEYFMTLERFVASVARAVSRSRRANRKTFSVIRNQEVLCFPNWSRCSSLGSRKGISIIMLTLIINFHFNDFSGHEVTTFVPLVMEAASKGRSADANEWILQFVLNLRVEKRAAHDWNILSKCALLHGAKFLAYLFSIRKLLHHHQLHDTSELISPSSSSSGQLRNACRRVSYIWVGTNIS